MVSTFGANAQHTSLYAGPSQDMNQIIWKTSVDLNPTYSQSGDLGIHYGAPLVTAGNTVIVPVKTGTGLPNESPIGFHLDLFSGDTGGATSVGGFGVPKFSLPTDYILPPLDAWTPSYSPVLASDGAGGTRLYYAGAGGTVYYINNPDAATPPTPVQEAFYGPLSSYQSNQSGFNSTVFIDTPITADSHGDIFFGFRVSGTAPAPLNYNKSGYARIDPSGNWDYVFADTAAGNAADKYDSPNLAPALSRDGSTLYVVVKGDTIQDNPTDNYTAHSVAPYLLGLNSTTLETKYIVALADPRTNNINTAWVPDSSTASPMVAPDGTVFFGILVDPFNGSRGFMLHFSADLGTPYTPGGFGWDDTDAIVPASMVPSYHGTSSYLIFTKYNNYADPGLPDAGDGINKIAILDPSATEVDPHPSSNGLLIMKEVMTIAGPTPDPEFRVQASPLATREWCINTAAVDQATDSIIVPSEDGNVYRWDLANNSLSQTINVGTGRGEPYVPTIINPNNGEILTINNSTLFAIGSVPGVSIEITSLDANSTTSFAGGNVTFTVSVTNTGTSGQTPTGTIIFTDALTTGVTPPPATVLATVPLDSAGHATFSTSSLTAGNHFIDAVYSGDANFSAGSMELVQNANGAAIVTNTNDSGPGSLRQAIINVDNDPQVTVPDTIAFAIPPDDHGHFYYTNDGVSGHVSPANVTLTDASNDSLLYNPDPDYPHSWWSIQPVTALPAITRPIIIDGYTQPGVSPNNAAFGDDAVQRIQINGSASTGLSLIGGNSILRGMVINGFTVGLYLDAVGNDTVQGNFIGTDVSGLFAVSNTFGVDCLAPNSTIGGSTPGARNLISGNLKFGIDVEAAMDIVQGNFIGTNHSGTRALLDVSSNLVGNGLAGIVLNGPTVQQTLIGTDGNGLGAEGNVISGNQLAGIVINGSSANIVAGNYIGTDQTGLLHIPNGWGSSTFGSPAGAGVMIVHVINGGPVSSDNQIGGPPTGPVGLMGNTIAFNDGPGVGLGGLNSQYIGLSGYGFGNSIRGNSIHDNFDTVTNVNYLGIELGDYFDQTGADGVDPIDNPDSDNGENNLQNYPVLTSASSTGGSLMISGTLFDDPNSTYTVDFYTNPSIDPSGHGEGEYYLGSTVVTTDGNGNGSFSASFGSDLRRPFISATATDSIGDTSEFSQDTIQLNALNSGNLQSLITTLPTSAPNTITFGANNSTDANNLIAAVNGLPAESPSVTVVLNLATGTYNDVTASPPAGVTLVINGNGSTMTIVGHSPALTVTGGYIIVNNITLMTSTDSPTVLVTGGHLTLRSDVILETTGGTQAAISITGGSVDLGMTGDPGGNTLIVNGTGQFVQNSTSSSVPATGDTYVDNGTTLSASMLSYTALVSSASTTTLGQDLTFTATVSSNGQASVTPSGSVDFFDVTTQTDLGSVALSGGVASLTTSSLAPGDHQILATYKGDSNFTLSLDSVLQQVAASIIVLDSGAGGALSLAGNASMQFPGPIQVDSNSSSALSAGGNSTLSGTSIQIVGGYRASGGVTFSPAPVTGAAFMTDPFASLATPNPAGLTNFGAVSISGNSSVTITPGIYSRIQVSGNGVLTLEANPDGTPGIYIIEGGGFTVTGNASVSGSNVFIYNTGSNYPNAGGNFGGIALGGNGAINLSPPTTGTYAGILIFQSRADTRTLSLSGNALAGVTGTIYAPSAKVMVSGGASLAGSLVADRLSVSGNGVSTQVSDGSTGSELDSASAGTLLAGDLFVYVSDPSGLFSANEQARIQDAITAWDSVLVPYTVTITEVTDPSLANVIIDTGTTSAAGSAADGVLGSFSSSGEITILQGWNWFDGSDSTQIGASQYDFQTVVTHELGHALGLGGSADSTSPMFEVLATATVRRTPGAADLSIPGPPDGADPERSAMPEAGRAAIESVGPFFAAGPGNIDAGSSGLQTDGFRQVPLDLVTGLDPNRFADTSALASGLASQLVDSGKTIPLEFAPEWLPIARANLPQPGSGWRGDDSAFHGFDFSGLRSGTNPAATMPDQVRMERECSMRSKVMQEWHGQVAAGGTLPRSALAAETSALALTRCHDRCADAGVEAGRTGARAMTDVLFAVLGAGGLIATQRGSKRPGLGAPRQRPRID
jgi:uncharacterized repeat protein (TIGR01451 family)